MTKKTWLSHDFPWACYKILLHFFFSCSCAWCWSFQQIAFGWNVRGKRVGHHIPKAFLQSIWILRQTFSCKISPLHLALTPQQKICASNLNPRGSAKKRAQWGQKWKQKLSDPKSWMVAVRGELDTTNLGIPEILTKKRDSWRLIHSHFLIVYS